MTDLQRLQDVAQALSAEIETMNRLATDFAAHLSACSGLMVLGADLLDRLTKAE